MEKRERINCKEEVEKYIKTIEIMKEIGEAEKGYNEERKRAREDREKKREIGEKERELKKKYMEFKTEIKEWKEEGMIFGGYEKGEKERVKNEIDEYFQGTRYDYAIGETSIGKEDYLIVSTSNRQLYFERGGIATKSGIKIMKKFEDIGITEKIEQIFKGEEIEVEDEKEEKNKNPIMYYYLNNTN
ncbi:hypothetical protein ENUP19_0121G0143 [Entamoeba nuttalli]|uniref:Uncharacterized protein n=1 Tax=Entamoeba nuttalli TaxID=412467 RepID=A0ABQ0DIX0_9EUKA